MKWRWWNEIYTRVRILSLMKRVGFVVIPHQIFKFVYAWGLASSIW